MRLSAATKERRMDRSPRAAIDSMRLIPDCEIPRRRRGLLA